LPNYLKKYPLINRIIDANCNRAKEGLRVCEEMARFILNNQRLTSEFKNIRHQIDILMPSLAKKEVLLKQRDSLSDIGRDVFANEFRRKNPEDVFFANIQRVKESIRVLEEFSKLKDKKISLGFKKLRYLVYESEKRIAKIIPSLCGSR
jgi:thiamine-phosphate pyrophosphorylase